MKRRAWVQRLWIAYAAMYALYAPHGYWPSIERLRRSWLCYDCHASPARKFRRCLELRLLLESTRKVRADNTFDFNAARYEAPCDMRTPPPSSSATIARVSASRRLSIRTAAALARLESLKSQRCCR